jgi:hypothetical protein
VEGVDASIGVERPLTSPPESSRGKGARSEFRDAGGEPRSGLFISSPGFARPRSVRLPPASLTTTPRELPRRAGRRAGAPRELGPARISRASFRARAHELFPSTFDDPTDILRAQTSSHTRVGKKRKGPTGAIG